jgi:hypothetical protein
MAWQDYFQLRNTISATTYAPSIIPPIIRAKALSIADTETAAQAGTDVAAEHANILPFLPDPKPNSPYDYEWLKIKTMDGGTRFIGLPWLVESSIEVHTTTKFVIELDGIDPLKRPLVEEALQSNGFTITSFKVQS